MFNNQRYLLIRVTAPNSLRSSLSICMVDESWCVSRCGCFLLENKTENLNWLMRGCNPAPSRPPHPPPWWIPTCLTPLSADSKPPPTLCSCLAMLSSDSDSRKFLAPTNRRPRSSSSSRALKQHERSSSKRRTPWNCCNSAERREFRFGRRRPVESRI